MFPVNGTIGSPLAWRDFLKRRPDLSSENVEPAMMKMTIKRFWELAGAMTFGAKIRYRRDVYPDGRPTDKWELPEGDEYGRAEGDCEDIALARLVYLLKLGWPRVSLRMTVCYFIKRSWYLSGKMPEVVWHAVLQVDTDHGTWVLDNLQTYYRRWTRLAYYWLWRETPGSKTLWEKFRKG